MTWKKPTRRSPRRQTIVASSPGMLRALEGAPASNLAVIAYGPDDLHEEKNASVATAVALHRKYPMLWLNVSGLGSLELLEQLAAHFNLHGLAMEDVLNVSQRPKIEDYEQHLFVVARMPVANTHLKTEQLSAFVGDGFVLTFQEVHGDCLEGVRERLRNGRKRIREGRPDYLLYAILDALVDSYFPLLATVRDTLDALEEAVQDNPRKEQVEQLYQLRRDLVTLRRYVEPLRDLNATLLRPDNMFLRDDTRIYMRDCYDHSIHALALVDSYRDVTSGLMELYLSIVSHKMNEVMKVLTIIATVFIPLSFIAGLYGMNFDPGASKWNMPELALPFGYPLALGIMAACAFGMLLYFRRKGWFD